MTPSFADRLHPMLEAAPAQWLASHRDPTLSLAPLSHFVMDTAPTGNVELLTTPFRGSSVLPEGMTEIELDMALAEFADGDGGDSPVKQSQSRVWIPRRINSVRPQAQPQAKALRQPSPGGEPQVRPQAQPQAEALRQPLPGGEPQVRVPQRSLSLGAPLNRARADIAPPIVRKSDLLSSPGGEEPTSGVSGGWSVQGDWMPLSGPTRASGWTQSLKRDVSKTNRPRVRASAPIVSATGVAREPTPSQPPVPKGEPSTPAPLGGPSQDSNTPTLGHSAGAPSQLQSAPGNGETQIRGSWAPVEGSRDPASTHAPAVRPEVSGPVSELSQRGLVGSVTDQVAAIRVEDHSDAGQGAGVSEASNLAMPQRNEVVAPRAIRGSDGAGNETPAGRTQRNIATPRPRLGLGEPMYRLPDDRVPGRPSNITQGSPIQSPSAQSSPGDADSPLGRGGASVVYSKRALGKMTVTGSNSGLRSQYPVFRLDEIAPSPERSDDTLDLDSYLRPDRPMVANRSMTQESGSGSFRENSAFTAPGLGEVSLRRDALADDRLAQTKALGLAKGKDIDLSGQLGSLSNPRALGVFAHEMTHLYQQQAMGGSRMPMAGTAEFRLLEAQAESVRHSVENSPAALVAGGGVGRGAPPQVGPASSERPSGGALPPRALAVARVASAAVTHPAHQQVASSRDATSNHGGARTPSGPINTRPKAQTVYSPVAGAVAAAGGAAGAGGPPSAGDGQPFMGTSSFFKKFGGDKSNTEQASSKKKVPFTESELNFLYRELLHRIKNQLRWEADRTGNMNRFFKD